MSKFKSRDRLRDINVCVYNINRIFLRNTLKVIQLSVLHYIFTHRFKSNNIRINAYKKNNYFLIKSLFNIIIIIIFNNINIKNAIERKSYRVINCF